MNQFALYDSHYAHMHRQGELPWSVQALRDFQVAAQLHGYLLRAWPFALLQLGVGGSVLAMRNHYGTVSVLLLAYRTGTQEVEGMALTTGGRAEQQLVWHDLVWQMRATENDRS